LNGESHDAEGEGEGEGADPASRVFAALADPTRRQVLGLLGGQGELTATALADRLPISRQAIVKHLTVLGEAGLVAGRRVGREVRYAVRPEALVATARWMAALANDWDRRLAAIKRIAEASASTKSEKERAT
jgi:DNA-binding transcriptional ArsR family regulator